VHVPPSGPVYPVMHLQLVERILALGDCVFTGHAVQRPEPREVLYFEIEHAEHAPPSAPVYPELHTQRLKAVLPAVDVLFPGQLKQVPAEEATVVVKYVPAVQLMQVLAPTVGEYVPTPQDAHVSLPEHALYFPARHNTHIAPSDPVAPGLQLQFFRRADPRVELEYKGQRLQVALPTSDHVPVEHVRQVSTPVAPLTAEDSPPAHLEHSYRFSAL
jgi:hypothetical protein